MQTARRWRTGGRRLIILGDGVEQWLESKPFTITRSVLLSTRFDRAGGTCQSSRAPLKVLEKRQAWRKKVFAAAHRNEFREIQSLRSAAGVVPFKGPGLSDGCVRTLANDGT